MELFKKENPLYFHIAKEDGFLFEAFERLYTKICNYDVDFVEEEDMSINSDFSKKSDNSENERQRSKDSYLENPLVKNGIIPWHLDENMGEIASILNIRKLDEQSFQLEFIKNNPKNKMYMTYSVCVCNSGSTYVPYGTI